MPHFHAFVVERLNDRHDVFVGNGQPLQVSGALNFHVDDMRLIGEVAEQVQLFQYTADFAFPFHYYPAYPVARHQQQGIEKKLTGIQADEVEMGDIADRGVAGDVFVDHRPGHAEAGYDADFIPFADQQGVDGLFHHRQACLVNGGVCLHENRWVNVGIVDGGGEKLGALSLGERAYLLGQVFVEVGLEKVVVTGEIHEHLPRQEIADDFLRSDEIMTGTSL